MAEIPVTTFDRSGLWICVALGAVLIVMGYVHHNDDNKGKTWMFGTGAVLALVLAGAFLWVSSPKAEHILCFIMVISAVGTEGLFVFAKRDPDVSVTKLQTAAYRFAIFALLALAGNFWIVSDPSATHGITGYVVGALALVLVFVACFGLATIVHGLAATRERMQVAHRYAPRTSPVGVRATKP